MIQYIKKLKNEHRGYIAILLAVLAPLIMALFYLYIRESYSNLNQVAVNVATQEAALNAARNYYDADLIPFKSQQQFLDRKATTVFNAIMKSRVGLKNNVIPMKKTSVMYAIRNDQNGITGFLADCKWNDIREYDPDFEYMRPVDIVPNQKFDWYFDVQYARRSNTVRGTEEYFVKDGSAKSGNTLEVARIDSDKVKVYADVHLDTDGYKKKYTAEYIAKAPACDVDIVIGVPVNKNLGQKAKEISDALRMFVKNWLPVRGCAIGVIPYSGKVGIFKRSDNYHSSKKLGEEHKTSIPISNSYKYYGSDGDSLYVEGIDRTHYGIIGLMFDFDTISENGNLKGKLFELITSDVFTYAPLNVCYGGHASVATGLCRKNTKNYQYSCPMVGLSYDLLSVYRYVGLLNDGFNDSSSFLYLPIMFGMSMLTEGGYTPPALDGFTNIDHINDDNTKKVAIIIANQADKFEHSELTYFGYSNDASYVSMVDGDKLDFENGNIVKIDETYNANYSDNSLYPEYYKKAQIKTSYDVTNKDKCERGEVVVPQKQNMRFILASLPFVRIYKRNGHFNEIEVSSVHSSNSVVLDKEDYYQCFILKNGTDLTISYSGNAPVLVKMEFFECEVKDDQEPTGYYLRQDTDFVYVCRKGTSAAGTVKVCMKHAEGKLKNWWPIAYCENHLLGNEQSINREGVSREFVDNFRDSSSEKTIRVCNVRVESTAKVEYRENVEKIDIKSDFLSGRCQMECSNYRKQNNVWDCWYCLGYGNIQTVSYTFSNEYKGYDVLYYSGLNVSFKRGTGGDPTDCWGGQVQSPQIVLKRGNTTLCTTSGNINGLGTFYANDVLTLEPKEYTQIKHVCKLCTDEVKVHAHLGYAEVEKSSIKVHYLVPTDFTTDIACEVMFENFYPYEAIVRSCTYQGRDKFSFSLTINDVSSSKDVSGVSKGYGITSIKSQIIQNNVVRELKIIKSYPYARIYTKNQHSGFTVQAVVASSGGSVVKSGNYFDCYIMSDKASFSVDVAIGDKPYVLAKMDLYEAEVSQCDNEVRQDSNSVYICSGESKNCFSITFRKISKESEMEQHKPLAYYNDQILIQDRDVYYNKQSFECMYNINIDASAKWTRGEYRCRYDREEPFSGKYKLPFLEQTFENILLGCTLSRECRDVDHCGIHNFCEPNKDWTESTGELLLDEYDKDDLKIYYDKLRVNLRRIERDDRYKYMPSGDDWKSCRSDSRAAAKYLKIHGDFSDTMDQYAENGEVEYDIKNEAKSFTFILANTTENVGDQQANGNFYGRKVSQREYQFYSKKCNCSSDKCTARPAYFGRIEFSAYVRYHVFRDFSSDSGDLSASQTYADRKEAVHVNASAKRDEQQITYALSVNDLLEDTHTETLVCADSADEVSYGCDLTIEVSPAKIMTRKFNGAVSRGNIHFTSGYAGPQEVYALENGYTQIYIPKEHMTGNGIGFELNNVFVSAIEWCNVLGNDGKTYIERITDAQAEKALDEDGNEKDVSIKYNFPGQSQNAKRVSTLQDLVGGKYTSFSASDTVGDLSIIADNCPNHSKQLVELFKSDNSSQECGYLNGVNRFFETYYEKFTGIRIGAADKNSRLVSAEYTLPINRILEKCFGQRVKKGAVNKTPTEIMQNEVSVKACEAFNAKFGSNGRLYLVKYKCTAADSKALDKLKTYHTYSAKSKTELENVLNEILADIEEFADYEGATIISGGEK